MLASAWATDVITPKVRIAESRPPIVLANEILQQAGKAFHLDVRIVSQHFIGDFQALVQRVGSFTGGGFEGAKRRARAGEEDLERDTLAPGSPHRLEHDAHAATAQLAHDLVFKIPGARASLSRYGTVPASPGKRRGVTTKKPGWPFICRFSRNTVPVGTHSPRRRMRR